jgi:hypothetical protein
MDADEWAEDAKAAVRLPPRLALHFGDAEPAISAEPEMAEYAVAFSGE